MILALALAAALSLTDPASVVGECQATFGGPTQTTQITWDPERWPGPAGGDPIALGDELRAARIGWRVIRVGETWYEVSSSITADLRVRRVEISQMVPDPPLVVGAAVVRCGLELEPLGAIAAQWDEERRLYVGPRLVAARYGSEVRVWVWVYDEGGQLTQLAVWRGQ